MTEPIRRDAYQAVAYLVRQIRPDWTRPDIESVLYRIPATVGLPRIAVAALIAAETAPATAGPGYIKAHGPHWQPFPTTANTTDRAVSELDRQHQKRRRQEHEWERAPKPTPQRINELRHLARHGITPTSPEAPNWLRSNPPTTAARDTPRPPVLSLQHNNHDNTVTITFTVPEADATTYQQLIRDIARGFTEPERPKA